MSTQQPSSKRPHKKVPGPGHTTPDIPEVADLASLVLGTDSSTISAFGEFDDKKIRNAFIAKVYLILSAQLLISSGFILLCVLTPGACVWIRKNPAYTLTSYGVFLPIYIVLTCCKKVRRKAPGNFVALFVFTMAFSYMAGGVTCAYSTVGVLESVGVTAICCFLITFIAVFGCVDFTRPTVILTVMIVLLVVMGGSCTGIYFVFGINETYDAIYGAVAAFIFTLYLVYDTQLIIGGRTTEISPEEYIFGALQLYVDVLNLLFAILKIFRRKK
ncbi:unnamed protein product [Calicophoron daubneyi]|uniref:Uncharacterized protein n=1 Tax=Calicophoron daubneyi TaxID=300641 RepID=A0AAV2U235_CALDB